MSLTCADVRDHLFSHTAVKRKESVSRVLGRQAPGRRFEAPAAKKKIEKFLASRARVFITRARFRMTRMRPRAVARRGGPAKTFASIFRGVPCAATARRRRGPTTEEVRR